MGADTAGYQKFYKVTAQTSWEYIFDLWEFEPGFVIFEKLLSYISASPMFFQFVYTTVYLVCIVYFANQQEHSPFLFLYFFATLGLYTFMFTGVRQCLAMCICLCSYRFIQERKLLPFLILVALAFVFHKSSIVFAASYFIYSRKLKYWNIILYVLIAIVFLLDIEFFHGWFNDQLDFDYSLEQTGNGFIYLMVMAVITVCGLLSIKQQTQDNSNMIGIFNISLIALLFWILRLRTRTAERMSYYFLFYSMALLSNSIFEFKKREEKIAIGIMAIVFSMLLYIYRFITNLSSMVPYKLGF